MSPKLTITLAGPAASGKTFAAVIIEQALRERGFDVTLLPNKDGDQDAKRAVVSQGNALDPMAPVEIRETHLDYLGRVPMGLTQLRRCPDPSGPGVFIVRERKSGALSVAEVKRGEDGCLKVYTCGRRDRPISEFKAEAKWWGPVELKR